MLHLTPDPNDLPPQLRNALALRGLVAVPKGEWEYLTKLAHDSVRRSYPFPQRDRRWRSELNPLVHIRRRRFEKHLDQHGCSDSKRGGQGFGYCEEAMRLFCKLPADEQVIMG